MIRYETGAENYRVRKLVLKPKRKMRDRMAISLPFFFSIFKDYLNPACGDLPHVIKPGIRRQSVT